MSSITTRKSPKRGKATSEVKIGQLVVLVEDVDGVEAGREGFIMGARDEMLTVGCQTSERLHLVLAHPWQLLLREHFHRLSKRESGE
jgi:hypothetical protein